MAKEKVSDVLELEKVKLERFKVWGRIITATVTVVFGSVIAAYINYEIQTRQLDQQKLLNETKLALQTKKEATELALQSKKEATELALQSKREAAELELQSKKEAAELKLQESKARADQRQAEMKYLGEFVELALEDDHTKRLRFAEYFAKLTISGELQGKWEDYRDGISDTITLLREKKVELAKAEGEEEKRKISAEVVQLQAKLDPLPKAPLPKKPDKFLYREDAGLDEGGKPIRYTVNKYEPQVNDKVPCVYDKATNLIWQQSGSDDHMSYDKAKMYIAEINRDGLAGYNDWQLPTLDQAKTLLDKESISSAYYKNHLFIDSSFDQNKEQIWTSDKASDSHAWAVYFNSGTCCDYYMSDRYFVRAVRLAQ